MKPVFTYLIGELYRRTGKFQEAVSWFGKVETSDPFLAKLSSRQKTLALNKNLHRARLDVIQ
jgi:hypothetical protein